MIKNDVQQYCVAAQVRTNKMRLAITQGTDYQTALLKKAALSKIKSYKEIYRYFHVAKFPYKVKTNQ